MGLLTLIRAAVGFLLRHWRLAAVLTLAALCWLAGARHERAKWELVVARQATHDAEKATAALEAARKREQEWQALADVMANQAHATLQETLRENDKLRADVDATHKRLRVAASCPGLPKAADGAGVDSGAGAELDAAARPAYFALRTGILQVEAKLTACQAAVGLLRAERR